MTRPEAEENALLANVDSLSAPHGLMAMGGLHSPAGETPQTLVLVGTAADFWQTFSASPEYADAKPDPLDRWSQRVLPIIAETAGASDVAYPFGGPPYAPFLSWAKATGQAFDSPTGMLVHAKAGLMISYRGALIFSDRLALPTASVTSPCDACPDHPCVTACPVDALSDLHFYDVPACKGHIASKLGGDCMNHGCATRLACPISQVFNRSTEQTAFHMRAFRGN